MTFAENYLLPVRDLSDREVDRAGGPWAAPVPGLSERLLVGLSMSPAFDDLKARAFDDLMSRHVQSIVAAVGELPDNWDSYGGRGTSAAAASIASSVLFQLLRQGVPAPSLVPRGDGGIALEWHTPAVDFVVNVTGDQPLTQSTAFYSNENTGEEWEESLAAALPRVEAALGRLTVLAI